MDKWRGEPSMQQIAARRSISGAAVVLLGDELTSLARQIADRRAERPAVVIVAPIERIVSDDAGAQRARL
jgi:nucleoside phosphorylase